MLVRSNDGNLEGILEVSDVGISKGSYDGIDRITEDEKV